MNFGLERSGSTQDKVSLQICPEGMLLYYIISLDCDWKGAQLLEEFESWITLQ